MGVHFRENEEKLTLGMIIVGIVIIAVLLTSLIVYVLNGNNKGMQEVAREEQSVGKTELDDDNEFETVSIEIGKTVNEAEKELKTEDTNQTHNKVEQKNSNFNNTSIQEVNAIYNKKKEENANTSNVEKTEKVEKEVAFQAPLKGEILREFAPDSLVYSETLEEWVTHNGVDIKADKTSVVTSAAEGTVYAIKNDPRYGLTVIINHEGGYQTIYANLLTAEYVVQGEKVEVGQTIGTIGNSATFEIMDDYHLHFEMQKNGEYINPNSYMQF